MDMFGNRSGSLIVALLLAASNALATQAWYSPISINAAQVPSTQSDFPVLVSQTDARFKTIANSGHVANSNGYDIRPYSDTGLTTALSYELERYNATTGEVVMWVKVGSLSSSTTPIYLGYGDTGLTTDGSSSSTWSNSFLDVYHLKDGTTLSGTDSLGSFNMGLTNSPTAVTGQIDGAAGLASASSQFLSNDSITITTAMTISAWVKGTTFPSDYNGVITRGTGGVDYFGIFVKSNGKLYCIYKATTNRSYDGTGSNTLSTGTWYYLTASYSSSAGLIGKVNAGSDGTATADGNIDTATNKRTAIGEQGSTDSRRFNGSIDEVRLSSVARSADWITTEYNNQNAPGTFETLGTEVAFSSPQRAWFIFFE